MTLGVRVHIMKHKPPPKSNPVNHRITPQYYGARFTDKFILKNLTCCFSN